MTEPPVISISWSQLRAHEECKRKSYLIRTGKRGPSTNLRSYYHGMVVDHVMRKWLTGPEQASGVMPSLIDDAMFEVEQKARDDGDGVVRWRGLDDRTLVREFCVELVRRLEPILVEHVLPYEYQQAVRFRTPVTVPYLDGNPATIKLIGEMDLLVRHPQPAHWVIWDLKGTKDDQYWRKVLGQLVFYDLAVLATYQEHTAKVGFIQPMCSQPVLEFVLTDDDRRAMWGRILRMVEDVWREDIECKVSTTGCGYCEVRHACPRFRPETTDAVFGTLLEGQ